MGISSSRPSSISSDMTTLLNPEKGLKPRRAQTAQPRSHVAETRQHGGEGLRKAQIVPSQKGGPTQQQDHIRHHVGRRRGDHPVLHQLSVHGDDGDMLGVQDLFDLPVQQLSQQQDAGDLDAAG